MSSASSTKGSATRRTSSTSATAARSPSIHPALLPPTPRGACTRPRDRRHRGHAFACRLHLGQSQLAAQGATFLASKGGTRDSPSRRRGRRPDRAARRADVAGDRDTGPHTRPSRVAALRRRSAGGVVQWWVTHGWHGRAHRPVGTGATRRSGAPAVPGSARRDPDVARRPSGVSDAWRGSFCSAPGASERTTTIGHRTRNQPDARRARQGHVRRTARRRVGTFRALLTPAGGEPARSPPLLGAPDTRASRRHRSG